MSIKLIFIVFLETCCSHFSIKQATFLIKGMFGYTLDCIPVEAIRKADFIGTVAQGENLSAYQYRIINQAQVWVVFWFF